MFKENSTKSAENFDLVRTLAPQTKMRILLGIFDLGKDKIKNEERKNSFITLMGKYYQSGIREKTEKMEIIESSEISKKKLHNQIMEIIRSMSLSQGLDKSQQQLTEYLVRNREEVEKMIGVYFLGYNPADPQEQSLLKQAMRGDAYFGSVPGKKDE